MDKKAAEVGDGIVHLGNDIGMFWSNLKHDIEERANDWMKWLINLLMQYAVLAVLGLVALVFTPVLLSSLLTVWLVRRGQAPRRRPRLTLRHA